MAAVTGSVVLIGWSEACLMWAHLSWGSDVVHSVGQRRNGLEGGEGRGEGRGKCGKLSVTEGEGVGERERESCNHSMTNGSDNARGHVGLDFLFSWVGRPVGGHLPEEWDQMMERAT